MATTKNTYTGNGSTKNYAFTFPYINQTDVKASVAGAVTTDFTFANATTLAFNTAPANNAAITIYRSTDDSNLVATFYPGSAIRSSDLNDNYTQNLYSTQENTNDATEALGNSRALESGVYVTAIAKATTALSTANTASTNATNAVATANSASASATTAVNTANTANTTAGNAVNTANAALPKAGGTMTGNIVFEGSTTGDGNETTLTVVDPTADRTITLPNVTGTVVTTGDSNTVTSTMMATNSVDSDQYVDGSIDLVHMSANSVDSDQYVDGSIDTAHIADSQITNTKLGDLAVTSGKLANDAVINTKLGDLAVTTDKLANISVTTAKIADSQVTTAKLGPDAVTSGKIGDNELNSEHYAAASIDTEHIASLNITTALIADVNVTTGKIADNAVTMAKVGCEQTTITDSDSHVPTSGAVVDYVAGQLAPIGGFEAIATEVAFMATSDQPASGVIVSISDAAGVVVNGSGVSTTGRTTDGTPATVTINNFPSSLHDETLAAGVGLMVSSTGTGNVYNYHKILAAEGDVKQLSDDINDFNARYRVGDSDPGSANDEGDLFFNKQANKMKVYDGSAWGEVMSAGDYKYLFLCPAGGTGAPTINGSIATYDLRESSNSGSAASVNTAAQLMVSVNGVMQKPNTGTSAPAEGFALVDTNTIIFGANLPTGAEVFITQVGTATTLNTPADNSVTTAKIASAAVTTAKIADDAVDGAKLANNIDIAGTLDVTGAATFDSSAEFDSYIASNRFTVNGALSVNVGGTDYPFAAYDASSNLKASITEAGGATFAGPLAVTGQNGTHAANSIRIGEEGSGAAQIRCYGPDGSTNGSLTIKSSRSDGSNSIDTVFSSTGAATFGDEVT